MLLQPVTLEPAASSLKDLARRALQLIEEKAELSELNRQLLGENEALHQRMEGIMHSVGRPGNFSGLHPDIKIEVAL